MERVIEPHLIAKIEGLLNEYCTKLSLDSISLFKENGKLLFSSDPSIKQPEGSVFGTLDAIAYSFITGAPHSIIYHDSEKYLIIIPLYPQNWGEIEAWIVAHGKCSDVNWNEFLGQMMMESNKKTEHDLSQSLETEQNRSILERAYYLPKIIGLNFDFMEGTTVSLRGDEGVAVSTLGEPPWGTTKPKWGDKYPDLLVSLEELGMMICSEIVRVLIPEEEHEPESKPAEKNPIPVKLLMFTLFYGIFLMLIDPQTAPITLGAIVLVLVVVATRKPGVMAWFVSIALIVGGILAIFISILAVVDYPNYVSLSFEFVIFIPRGLYVLLLGNLFRILYGVKLQEDEPEN